MSLNFFNDSGRFQSANPPGIATVATIRTEIAERAFVLPPANR